MHQIFIKVNYFENKIASGQNEKFVLLSAKVKSLAHLFKGGRGQGGRSHLVVLAAGTDKLNIPQTSKHSAIKKTAAV